MSDCLSAGTVLKSEKASYQIVDVLGQGSFGITYRAVLKNNISTKFGTVAAGQTVAIKEFFMREWNQRADDTLTVQGTGKMIQNYRHKFKTEANNLSKLDSPRIAKVLDTFDMNDTSYYAMEYISGDSLDHYITTNGHISSDKATELALEICEGVKFMHDRKMIHLDIKPLNVMMRRNGHIVLIDFGLSKQYDEKGEPESSTTIGLGTPGYAPIEQANYRQDGTFPATLDVYAIGATIYKMLTGKTPMSASEIVSNGFPPCPDYVDARLWSVVRRAMSLKRERHQNVNQLMAELSNKDIPVIPSFIDDDTQFTPDTSKTQIIDNLNAPLFSNSNQTQIVQKPSTNGGSEQKSGKKEKKKTFLISLIIILIIGIAVIALCYNNSDDDSYSYDSVHDSYLNDSIASDYVEPVEVCEEVEEADSIAYDYY